MAGEYGCEERFASWTLLAIHKSNSQPYFPTAEDLAHFAGEACPSTSFKGCIWIIEYSKNAEDNDDTENVDEYVREVDEGCQD